MGFRWIDDLEQRASVGGALEWRFSRRVATTEWIRRFADDEFSVIPDRFLKGRRDRDDPVYLRATRDKGPEGSPAL